MRSILSLAALLLTSPAAFTQLGANHCRAVANSTGVAATLTATGSPDVGANDVTLHGGSLPPGALTLLLSSTERAVLPGFAGTASTLCLGGALGRHYATVTVADASGAVSMPLDTQQVPHSTQPFALVRGDTLNLQLWFRDLLPSGAATSGLSDGLSITFCPEPPFEGERNSLPASSYFAFTADLDSDGVLDVVCANYYSFSVLFGRSNGGFEPTVVLPVISVQFPYVRLEGSVDIDGNGLTDLLCSSSWSSSGSGLLSVIEQSAPREFAAVRVLPLTDRFTDVLGADVDGDGDIDLVGILEGRLALHVLRGDGAGGFGSAQILDAPVGSSFYAIGAADLSGDGASELYATTSSLTVRVYASGGAAGLVHTATRSVGTAPMVFFDVDADGDDDYVAPGVSYTSVLRNEGGGTLALLQERYASPPGSFQTHEDVDGDGDEDLVFLLQGGDLQTLWNDGSGVFYPTAPADIGVPEVSTRYVDVDGDGHFEALHTGLDGRWLDVRPRIGPELVATYPSLPSVTVLATPVLALDVDADGFEELVTFPSGELELVHYAAGWSSPQVVRYSGTVLPSEVDFGDVDGDGDLDLLALGNVAGVMQLVTHYQVSPLTFAQGSSFPVAPQLQNQAVADLDDDGDADVVLWSSTSALVHAYLNVGGLWQGPIISNATGHSPLPLQLADVTRDGRVDLVYRGSSGYSLCEGLLGGAFGPTVALGVQPLYSGTDFLLADLDGDGAVEFIQRSDEFSGTWVAIHRSTGPNLFDSGVVQSATYFPKIHAFDREGDGDLDLLGGCSPNGIVLFVNDGNANLAPTYIHTGFAPVTLLVAGDFDRDGDRDVIFGASNTWRVLENHCR